MRDRLTLPLFLPLLIVAALLAAIWSFGRALLELAHTNANYASIAAIVIAAGILALAAILAAQPRLTSGWPVYVATALPTAVILASGMYYLIRPFATEGGGGESAAALAPPGPIAQVMTDNKFSETEITVVANGTYTVDLTNRGAALHNMNVLNVNQADGQPFKTSLLAAGGSETATFTFSQAGEYNFQCDVHPVEMRGRLTVVAEGSPTGAGAGAAGGSAPVAGPGKIVSIATDNKFNPVQLQAQVGQETTLTLENRGAQIHNLHIQNVKGPDGRDIQTKLLPGGASETITFTIGQAGAYPYICDVHPLEMKGEITVK